MRLLSFMIKQKKKGGARARNSFISKIINDVQRKRKLPEDVVIKIDTVCRRVSKTIPFSNGKGADPPFLDLEPILLVIIIQMARIR